MTTRRDFTNPEIVKGLKSDLVKAVKPAVAGQLQRRNEIRDKHQIITDRIAGLEARQEVLKDEIVKLRAEGAERIVENRSNKAISVKISAREAELKESQMWLSKLIPESEGLAKKLVMENRKLLEDLREAIQPVHLKRQAEMNSHLLAASQLKSSWFRAVQQAIDEVGDQENLSGGISAVNMAYRLKVDWQKSSFKSPGR
jgi:hypothetical protein